MTTAIVAPAWITDQAWEILRRAKSCALSERSSRVETRHLAQACVLEVPELVTASLAQLGCDEQEARARLARLSTPGPLPDPTGAALPLSSGANEVVARARARAGASPVGAGHLWESLCSTLPELADWLAERGWDLERVHRLAAITGGTVGSVARPIGHAERRQLAEYCRRNLTELASAGRLSPAHGMETIAEQLVRCLLRRGRRSAVLTGPAGVGKTKLVEDLAFRIAQGKIPELAGCEVFELDLTLLTRGTHLVGSRAERWAKLTEILGAHAERIILFIDELHTIVGMPIEGSAMDLANVMKPLLADGRVRIVGATTLSEYREHIEGDPALARRFTEVRVPEPDREAMLSILRNVAPEYERFHGVRYPEEALAEVYDRAAAGLPNQAFPAKAIDLLDEVGVYVKRGAHAGVERVVRHDDVRVVLARVGGVEPEGSATMDLAARLERRVVGQERAARRLADRVLLASHGYGRHGRRGPRAVLLFVGPPGVGKSHMGQMLADTLFPGRGCLLTLDMTEFGGGRNGEHASWRLLGPPPPYSGWETGGLLTCHAQRHPVSVVVVDELEKASPEAMNVLLRVLDEGEVQDGRGQTVSFRGTYFVLTSNAGVRRAGEARVPGFAPSGSNGSKASRSDDVEERVRASLLTEGFPPELLSRISDVVVFDPLTPAHLEEIARRMLARLREDALREDGVQLECNDAVLARWLVAQAGEKADARRVAAAFNARVEVELARWRIGLTAAARGAVLRLEPARDRITVTALAAASQSDTRQTCAGAGGLEVAAPA